MRRLDGRMCSSVSLLSFSSMLSTAWLFVALLTGSFCLLQLITEFDPVMHEHLRFIQDGEIHDYFLGKHTQNVFVQIMADNIKKIIVDWIKGAKYYSVFLDCTSNISHRADVLHHLLFFR